MFFDTHVHFQFPDFDADREEVFARAEEAGVRYFLNVGTDVAISEASLKIAEALEMVWASAGIHPHDAAKAQDKDFKRLEELLAHPKMVAIGEVGLDFYRDHSPRDVQRTVFERFIGLSLKTGKPLIIHCREAYDALIDMLKKIQPSGYRGVIHCFSADRPTLLRLVELGFHISFAGPLTYKKNIELRDACAACPVERLLLETDAPFLPPQSMRGKRNEPAFMIETATVMGDMHRLSPDALAYLTTNNAHSLFKI